MNIEEIIKKLKNYKKSLKKKFNIKELGVFGSFVKGTQTEKSDIDILIEFEKPIDMFTYLELEETLTQILGIKVDLVMKKSLKKEIGEQILQEVIYV